VVAVGLGNYEIARRLVLSERPGRDHVSAVLVKLQVSDRASAVAKPAMPASAPTHKNLTGSGCWSDGV